MSETPETYIPRAGLVRRQDLLTLTAAALPGSMQLALQMSIAQAQRGGVIAGSNGQIQAGYDPRLAAKIAIDTAVAAYSAVDQAVAQLTPSASSIQSE